MTLTTPTLGNVHEVDITREMQVAYLDYAMSVIVSRALPDVRDGLKPVHRRILYAMHSMGLTANKPYKKSARIVGEVLGKYHPHGDAAVYDAMVRMAQDFSLRYPLVDGQGNFGSIDGDNAAAMRYTEARLAPISDLMLADLEKDTVDWHPNFDNTLQEPDILPATLPNLLVNGASGIAVGMATNIPPHNLGEIVDALVFMLDRYHKIQDVTVEDLLRFVHGPDFPTGGIVYRYRKGARDEENIDAITQGYATGRARLIVQAKAHFEEISRGRTRIVVTELPYQTNKTNLLERIASMVRDGKLEGITDMRDESDRTGMRIVIELTRTVDPKAVLADLFKYTPMQQTFGMSMLALVDGEPKVLSLKRMLQLFIEHRREIVRRRSEHDLAKARARAHIVEGLLKALDILDEVIATIRRSQRVETARINLRKNFKFTEAQAQAILDMPLKRLAALERRKLQDEYKELKKLIRYLESLLRDPRKMLGVIKEELLALKEAYGDARRTQIVERTKGTLTTTDLLPDQTVWVTVGANGELSRHPFTPPSKTGLRKLAAHAEVALLPANTRDYLYLFTGDGRCARVSVHEIPEGRGKHAAEFTGLTRRQSISAAVVLPRVAPDEAQGALFLATEQGMVKRITAGDLVRAAAGEPEVIRLEKKDRLGWVIHTQGEGEVILVSAQGRSIRFQESDVRTMGLAAGGVGGMKLKRGDRLVQAQVVDPEGELLTVTEQGFAKRTPLSEYSRQGRNGGGIIAHKISARTGPVADARVVRGDRVRLLAFITRKHVVKPADLADVMASGRSTQGRRVVTLAAGDQVAAVQPVPVAPDARDNGAGPASQAEQPAPRTPSAKAGVKRTRRRATRSGNGTGPAPRKAKSNGRASRTGTKAVAKTPTKKARASKSTAPKSRATKSTAGKSASSRASARKNTSKGTATGTAKGTTRSAAKKAAKSTSKAASKAAAKSGGKATASRSTRASSKAAKATKPGASRAGTTKAKATKSRAAKPKASARTTKSTAKKTAASGKRKPTRAQAEPELIQGTLVESPAAPKTSPRKRTSKAAAKPNARRSKRASKVAKVTSVTPAQKRKRAK